MIRILVCDDHPVVREGLVMMLGTQPDMEVVGEAGDGLEAVERAAQFHPDVELMDLEMPRLDGPEAIRRIHEANPQARILVLTAYDTDERILQAVQAGARGYLLKGVPRDEIFQAVRVVEAGGSLLQPAVATKLLNRFSRGKVGPAPEGLTERELDVLVLVARGLSNGEIASALFLTEATVKTHLTHILAKLDVRDRVHAVILAYETGLVRPGE